MLHFFSSVSHCGSILSRRRINSLLFSLALSGFVRLFGSGAVARHFNIAPLVTFIRELCPHELRSFVCVVYVRSKSQRPRKRSQSLGALSHLWFVYLLLPQNPSHTPIRHRQHIKTDSNPAAKVNSVRGRVQSHGAQAFLGIAVMLGSWCCCCCSWRSCQPRALCLF